MARGCPLSILDFSTNNYLVHAEFCIKCHMIGIIGKRRDSTKGWYGRKNWILKEIYNLGNILPHLKQMKLLLKNCQGLFFSDFFNIQYFCRTFYFLVPMPQEKKSFILIGYRSFCLWLVKTSEEKTSAYAQ